MNNPSEAVRDDLPGYVRNALAAIEPHHAATLKDHITALAAEVEGLRADARRYRFLQGGPERPCEQPCVYQFLPGDKEYPTPIGGKTLDAAIDAAMQEKCDG